MRNKSLSVRKKGLKALWNRDRISRNPPLRSFVLCTEPMSKLLLTLCALPVLGQDAASIMAKVAANVEQATDARKQYIYHQRVRSSLVRASGDVGRREKREYSAFPG